MSIDDLLDQRETDAGAFLLRREEGDEDPVPDLFGDSGPVVPNRDGEEVLPLR